ncbi:MAG: hypothetical protein AAFU60_16145, partial [Bacteroidota bacterium]
MLESCSPSLVSYATLYTDLPPSRFLTLSARDLIANPQDICGSGMLNEVVFVASGLGYHTFTCADLGSHDLLIELSDDNAQRIQVQVTLEIQDIQGDCDGIGFALVNDNCDPNPILTYVDQTLSSSCPAASIIERTWTVTDASGNSTSGVQTITVEDSEDPELLCPIDQMVALDINCSFQLPDYTTQVTAGDACSSAITLVQVPNAGSSITSDTEVTITATDDCGNQATCSFWVFPTDQTAPSLSCLDDQLEVVGSDCTFQVPDYASLLVASDNCTADLALEQFPSPGTTITANTQVTIITEDAVGNPASCSFQIILSNNAPILSSTPSDLTVACADDIPGDQGVTATDDCDGIVTVIFSQNGLPLACPG